MTPKSLLRNPAATSSLEALSSGRFQRIIRDDTPDDTAHDGVRRVLLCSGKIYYELDAARKQRTSKDVAIVRVEQLYPLQDDSFRALIEAYRPETSAVWVQEEPENMGAWRFLRARYGHRLFDRLPFSLVSRPAAASPATGSASSHRLEQQRLIANAFQL
jgi:2-oxoglutarate dehydrogenase E1 component